MACGRIGCWGVFLPGRIRCGEILLRDLLRHMFHRLNSACFRSRKMFCILLQRRTAASKRLLRSLWTSRRHSSAGRSTDRTGTLCWRNIKATRIEMLSWSWLELLKLNCNAWSIICQLQQPVDSRVLHDIRVADSAGIVFNFSPFAARHCECEHDNGQKRKDEEDAAQWPPPYIHFIVCMCHSIKQTN